MGKTTRSKPASQTAGAAPDAFQHVRELVCADTLAAGAAGQSLPAQAGALLEVFARLPCSVANRERPDWFGREAAVVIRAVNAGRVRMRHLLDYLPHIFCDLALGGLACSSSSPDWPCPPEVALLPPIPPESYLGFLDLRATWLLALVFVGGPANAPVPRLGSAARREVVQWIVQYKYHKVLAALLLTPAAAAGAEFARMCMLVLTGVCTSKEVTRGDMTPGDERIWCALRNDGFTVNAMLCWLARTHGRLPSSEPAQAQAASWLYVVLAATEAIPGNMPPPLALMPWDVVALPDSSEDWLQFDAEGGRLRVSVGLAQRAYRAFLVHMLRLDPQAPAVLAARRELAERVTRSRHLRSASGERGAFGWQQPSASCRPASQP